MIDYLKLTFLSDDNIEVKTEYWSKKADGINKPLELHKQFLRNKSNRSHFPIGSCC